MRRAFRKAALTGTSLIIAVAAMSMVGISAPAPAHAAGSCFASGCAGLDPNDQGCNANYEGKSDNGNTAVLENYYSTDCHSNWAWAELYQRYVQAGYSMYVYISTTLAIIRHARHLRGPVRDAAWTARGWLEGDFASSFSMP